MKYKSFTNAYKYIEDVFIMVYHGYKDNVLLRQSTQSLRLRLRCHHHL